MGELVQILRRRQGGGQALAHRLGHLKGFSGAVPGGKHPRDAGGHAAVHPDGSVLGLQTGQQIGGGHRLPENEDSGTGEKGPIRPQTGDGLFSFDLQAVGLDKGDGRVQLLRPLGGHIDHLTAQLLEIGGLPGASLLRPTTTTGFPR